MSESSRNKILRKNSQNKKFQAKEETSDDYKELSSNQILYNKEYNLRVLVKTVNENKNGPIVSSAYDKIEKNFEKYLNSKTAKYFIKGGDGDDIRQEGRLGLHKAIRDFDEKRGMSFVGFACMCIERHLVSTIKRGLRNKTEILNESQSLDQKIFLGEGEDDDTTLKDIICDENALNPEDNFIDKDQYNILKGALFGRLTAMERCVTDEYLRGYSYKTIARRLDIKPKSVDNAISRVKNKAQELDLDNL